MNWTRASTVAMIGGLLLILIAMTLTGCSPTPPGRDLWRAVDCVQKGTC